MKKLVKTRNLIIIILCLTIICLGIGFAFLSMELTNTKNNNPEFALEFVKAEPRTPVKGGQKDPTVISSITNDNQTINMEFNLSSPRDEIGYKIIIKNNGTIPAEITNIVEKPDYILDSVAASTIYPVTISHNDVIGKVLNPGDEIELNILAIFDYNTMPVDIKIPYQLSIIGKTPEN